jgi:hypothetical protein
MMLRKISELRGGEAFNDESGNKYIKLRENYEVRQHHCCNGSTISPTNCLLIIEGILMWLQEDQWVDT